MEKKLKFTKQFRYEVLATSENPKTIIYVLHGYGQLSKFFIRKFKDVSDCLIVAPEGMHRFYLQGSQGRVGASWMTKEAREDDIADNIDWLNELDKTISADYSIENKTLLGFSQGGATAARWEAMGNVTFDQLILWACVFPPDLNPELHALRCRNKHFAIGTQDQFYQAEDQSILIQEYREKAFDTHQFDGKHDIDNETLRHILRQRKVNE